MRIDRIIIENFKNFKKLDASFHPGVNLFLGANGSGKTSILEAINVALGGFFSLQEQKMQRMIDLTEARIEMIDGEPVRSKLTSISAESKLINGRWTRNFNTITKNNDIKYVKPAGNYGKEILNGFYEADKKVAPLIAYYSTMRLFKDAYQSSKQKFDPLAGRRNGYLQCLNDNAIKGTLIDWLGSAVTTRATKQIKGVEFEDLVLENVDRAIVQTLLYFLDDLKGEDVKIYQEAKFNFDVFLQLKPDFALPISYYSDGFRNLIYLIVDLIWRASQLNPWLTLDQLTAQQTGCVTIDEIDLHLHPKWQAKSLGILQELLPNVQFFVTTHSPTVVANFKVRRTDSLEQIDSLYVLERDKLTLFSSTFYGKDISTVLVNFMRAPTRAPEVDSLLKAFFRTADNPNSTEEELNQLSVLAEQLNNLLDGSDKDLIRVKSIVERLNMSKI